MIWSLPEIIAELSMFYTLLPGDLIFTGTPEGVGPLVPGDFVEAGIDGVDRLAHRIGPPK
jgi:fumarylpyruvate hydrolase